MRISTLQAFNNGVTGLQRNYAAVTRTQEQISTGNRILTPADDPVASVRLMQLEQQQGVLGQYQENLTAAKNSLTQEEVSLNSVNTVLQRIRELAVQAGDGALSSADRKSIAAEIREREDELLSLMNTRNARGEYLFAGFQGKTQPFVREDDGSYSYRGDEGQRTLQIASSLDIPISDNGKRLFENVINAGRLDGALTTTSTDFSVSPPLVSDEVAFAQFPPTGFSVTFDAVNPRQYRIDVNPVDPLATPLATGSLDDDPNKTDTIIHGGVTLKLDGAPAGGDSYAVTPPAPADARNKQGILNTIAEFRRTLENPSGTSGQVRDAVALVLTNLDHGMGAVDSARGDIGARLNIIETTQTDNEDVTLVNKAVQAELRELDYPEALSRLSFQSVILQAAQQSYVKISGLNLFNMLR